MKPTLVRYAPPKSSIWGHQSGRLRAADLATLGLRFLGEKCNVLSTSTSEFNLFLGSLNSSVVTPEVLEAAKRIIVDGHADVVMIAQGMFQVKSAQQQSVERIREIAENYDHFVEKYPNVLDVSVVMMNWVFAWENEPEPVLPMISPGGMFSILFGKPHRVSTMFTFRNLTDYFEIKDYLAEIGLCRFRDQHVRPKKLIEEWNSKRNPNEN